MCGIVGYVGVREAAPILLEGLKRLEYRGYDSAGMAVHAPTGLQAVRAAGKLHHLRQRTQEGRALGGTCGVGHTRWATHGVPDEANAHPQTSPGMRVAVVHNGVIENSRALRRELEAAGCSFRSQTDTEAAVILLDRLYVQGTERDPARRALHAIRGMMLRLEGSYAMGILFGDQPGVIYAAKKDSPLLIARCEGETAGTMLASDLLAMQPFVREAQEMGDMDIARLDHRGAQVYNIEWKEVKRPVRVVTQDMGMVDKDGYAHFMLKEIMEQPQAVRDTLKPRICTDERGVRRVDLRRDAPAEELLCGAERVLLVGCGSAYHAGVAGREVIERLARIPVECALASELRYRMLPDLHGTLAIIISQSGETADSLAALRLCRQQGMRTLAVVNAAGSAMAREADAVMLTHAGPEISVATTKAYAAQLACLYLLAVHLAKARGTADGERLQALLGELLALPDRIGAALRTAPKAEQIARRLAACRDVFYIGRGLDYAVAMEGSLKLKEVSYIHAEAYAAGELKHGSISLIEEGTPVIAAATQPHVLEKTVSGMAEAAARGAKLVAVAFEGDTQAAQAADETLFVPRTDALLAASVAAVPLQLLAYHTGCARGLDVDQPRNLAKSVTVE